MRPIIALDGEGYTDRKGQHHYAYLAASTETELVSEVSATRRKSLTFPQVADFLLRLPPQTLLAGFSLGYDRAKWFESLPDRTVWLLQHPDARPGEYGPKPVRWRGYRINLMSTLFTVADGSTTRSVWDFWKFFQCSFVKALTKWGVGDERTLARIERMKGKRSSFMRITREVRAYCQEECRLLAKLVRRLLEEHVKQGIPLRQYFGPGSAAGVILAKCNAEQETIDLSDPRLREAVYTAYTAGRFELSRVGPVEGPVYCNDLAGAYPAAFCEIPCMRHGRWVHRRKADWPEAEDGVALVRYRLEPHKQACEAWGPLPFRMPDGSLVFPRRSAGGWVWLEEGLAGLQLHPGIKPLESWVWRRDCDCDYPFRDMFLDLYERRLVAGKTAAGHTLRLGPNASYGTSAQRQGRARYRCMVRAGLITSKTRAKLLRAIATARNPWNVLELATDSILATEQLNFEPSPLGKLGSWEPKDWNGGVFLLRPGMRFELTEKGGDYAHTAARGMGTKVLHANRERVLRAWKRSPLAEVTVSMPVRFIGATQGVRRVRGRPNVLGDASWSYRRDDSYGQWVTPSPRRVSYAAAPKRDAMLSEYRMSLWELPLDGPTSLPYLKAPPSPLGELLAQLRDVEDDQPDRGDVELV